MARLRLLLTVLGLAISAIIVIGHSALYWTLTGRPWELSEDWSNIALVAQAFVLLGLLPAKRVEPWLVALGLTVLLWGWFLYDAVDYYWRPDGSGANIGMGFLL